MLLTQTRDKPKLNRHIRAFNRHTHIYINTKNKGKSKKGEDPKLETLPQH